jgi:hypothetical protein
MIVVDFIDLLQRRVNSFLFRLVLIAYALCIIFVQKTEFPTWVYLCAISAYFGLYLLLLKKSIPRLLNDFIFIIVILLGQNPTEPHLYIFLLLPIINTINFSGDKTSSLLYILSILVYAGIGGYYKWKYDAIIPLYNLRYLVPFLFLLIINAYTAVRMKYRKFSESLMDLVDSYYTEKDNIKNSRKIYKHLIEALGKSKMSIEFESIHCFTLYKGKTEKIVIVNGSTFIWNYKILNEKELLEEVRKHNIYYDAKILLENEVKPYNLVIHVSIGKKEYIFVFVSKQRISVYHRLLGIFRTLEPVMAKISKILLTELRLEEFRSDQLKELADSSHYVSRANKIMHFIRNRLTPPSNLLMMVERMEQVPEEKRKDFNSILNKEKDRTKLEMKMILDRANDMLEKGNNPFDFRKTERISIISAYIILSRMYSKYFPELSIKLNYLTSGESRNVELNETGFDFFLTDWLNNMNKYKKSTVTCELTYKNEELIISFCNDHNLKADEAKKMISDLKNIDRNEIMKRTTHGLYNVKTTLDDMGVLFDIVNDESKNEIILTLRLKTFAHENISI